MFTGKCQCKALEFDFSVAGIVSEDDPSAARMIKLAYRGA
jgi:hypothetical protein